MASLVACSCIRIFTAAIPALALSASLQTLDAAPFAEAVAVWHMSDLHDNAGADSALQTNGDVKLGVQLGDAERDESARRGGDGKAAEFHGGWFAAGHGADGELNLAGTGLTLCVRLRDPSGQWNAPLLSKHGGHARLSYNLFATRLGEKMAVGFELGTDFKKQPLQISFPTERFDATAWHDVIVRYSGHRLELFVDGVLVDEEWPAGALRLNSDVPCLLGAEIGDDNQPHGAFRGLIDHAALWNRALSDEEIVTLSGGREAVAKADQKLLGPESANVANFWKPRGNVAVGDCMPFFDGERWHLYYLVDRHAHRSKWGLGAHQWAHVSTADLKRWEHHPLAVPITDSREGSICTGSVFLHEGTYRAYYAVRTIDGSPAPLGVAVSRDGIHFTKTEWRQTLTAPYAGPPARDPHVFQDPRDGLFHMIVTTSLEANSGNERGCLAHLVSRDLNTWEQHPPFLVPGLPGEPECAEWFEWNGWYYLVFSNGGIARYRMSREPLGPWITPAVSAFDGNQCNVMKTAPFTGGRRIGAAFLPRAGGGYAGNVIFRELVQQPDGTLATHFGTGLTPKFAADPVLSWSEIVVHSAGARASLSFIGLPRNTLLNVRVRPGSGTKSFGLGLRAEDKSKAAVELRFIPSRRRVEVVGGAVLDDFDVSDKPVRITLYLEDDMLDVGLDGRRTLSSRVPATTGSQLVLFSEGADTAFEDLVVRSLEKAASP
ncbi:MAG TPA: LamG-like jellyroll fold domain-containing protein [Chthoniobacteraceae bacterium]|nr:LamG-like jellyroll fold domain-containing protein [Chthoniobacteraceae bacterium]